MTEIVKDARQLAEESAASINSTRTGKGTRLRVTNTRGKGSITIIYEAFDESKPDTLPETPDEFVELTSISDESHLANLLVRGFNDWSYEQSSDPIAQYLNPAWPEELSSKFRAAVRAYSQATNTSIEDTVAMMKPGMEAAFAASQA